MIILIITSTKFILSQSDFSVTVEGQTEAGRWTKELTQEQTHTIPSLISQGGITGIHTNRE